ncbi:hypothetical protein I3842_05G147700 [Carya illinoinensis]|uniref:Protein kinase domain-containing protein n=1 Tax=Carya illinoinensis TaxID=32201 RepID=A0A922JQJ5_CARIL|nr:hypothetical protein I3842_05G147700 [Carya illinoinensis]
MQLHSLGVPFSHQTNPRKPHSSVLVFLLLIITVNFEFSQTSETDCILNIQSSMSLNGSKGEASNWGGFINNSCGAVFDEYLHALGRLANQTGQIYLNFTEQGNCLGSMKGIDANITGCGIEKLTSGAGGCSDYEVKDVNIKLQNRLKILGEGCEGLDLDGKSGQACSECFRRWKEIGSASDNGRESMKVDADVCRFEVLVTLTSSRIDDEKWVKATYDCLGGQHVSIDGEEGTASSGIKSSIGLSILVVRIVGITIIVLIATFTWFRLRTRESFATGKDYSLSEEFACLKLPVKEIYSATNNLYASNFIGQGIAGKVYKGILSNGQHVAVKHTINDGYMDTFVREFTSLSHVRHPNLVALLCCCENEDECFLVYELCHNGNLSEWLFGKTKVLSWMQRVEIAIDGARGLWFLHTYPEGCIVHRDIKPANILLNGNYEARLSDFGLSKVMGVDQSHVSSEVRGTFGYVDPEYRKNHHVNASGDVYSFGIVPLQLLSGKRVISLDLTRPMPL